MPLYEYHCQECSDQFTRLRSVAERAEPAECPRCSSTKTELVFSRVNAGEVGCGSKTAGFT